jgi:S-DNA-T family DNA segregation ATPase FtsK/SpoIIIE
VAAVTTAGHFRVPFQGRPIAPAPVAWTARIIRALGRLYARTPHGLWRLLRPLLRWVADIDGRPPKIRRGIEDPEGAEAAARRLAKKDHLESLFRRAALAAVVLLAAAGAGLLVDIKLGPWRGLGLAALLLAGLGWAGRRTDTPVLDLPPRAPDVPALTPDLVLEALAAVGAPDAQLTTPVQRTTVGWQVDVHLPVLARTIAARREDLAGQLLRPYDCVWPEPLPGENPNRLRLHVRREPATTGQPWPIPDRPDLTRPQPIGVDLATGHQRTAHLDQHAVIGAQTRSGKTMLAVGLASTELADPDTDAIVIDCKGIGDWSPVRPLASTYLTGHGDQATQAARDTLASLRQEMAMRIDAVHDGHIAPGQLRRLALYVDECHLLFAHEVYGQEFIRQFDALMSNSLAVRIYVRLATQQPDRDTLPQRVAGHAGLRIAGRVPTQHVNDAVLGPGSYSAGHRATGLGKRQFIVSDGGQPFTVRSYDLDPHAAAAAVQRAAAVRPQTVEPEPQRTLLDDVLAVWPQPEITPKVWTTTLLAGLQRRWPEYADMTAAQLGAALNRAGSPTRDVKLGGVTRKGPDLAATQAATRARPGRYPTHTSSAR